MVRQTSLHSISKSRSDAALYPAFAGEYSGRGPKPSMVLQLDVRTREAKDLRADGHRIRGAHQDSPGSVLEQESSAFASNVVVILKTNLRTHAQADVDSFSTDLAQTYDAIIKFEPVYPSSNRIGTSCDAEAVSGLADFMKTPKRLPSPMRPTGEVIYGQLQSGAQPAASRTKWGIQAFWT